MVMDGGKLDRLQTQDISGPLCDWELYKNRRASAYYPASRHSYIQFLEEKYSVMAAYL